MQWVYWGAGNGNRLKVSMSTSTGTKSHAHATLDVTCLQDALWGLVPKHPNALSSSRFGHHDAASQGAEDTGQGVQPCRCGECCCALSFACWCVPWRGALERLWSPWEGGPDSQLSRSKGPVSHCALLPDVALLLCSPQMSCSSKCGARTGLICCLLLLLSSANKAFTRLSKVELSTDRLKGWLYLFLI